MIFQYIELYGTNRLSRESDSLSGFQLRSLPTANAKTQPLVLITSAQHSAIYRLPLLRYMYAGHSFATDRTREGAV
jgi:hypothetical protein